MEDDYRDCQFEYEKPVAPTSLKVVAWLFIISGVLSVIDIIGSLFNDHLKVDLGVLGIFVGLGLLKFKAGWRTCGLVFIWIGLILAPLFAVLSIIDPSKLHYKIFGQNIGRAPLPVALAAAGILFCIVLWQYRVLTRPDIRQMFLSGRR